MIRTIYGNMDESLLEKREIYSEVNGNKIHRTEYLLNGEEVRSDLNIIPAQLTVAGEQANLE